uniref:Uncharacterized protein n=1 Tax=Anguilla anguilla TaxID=7936 RepID=A0A0E9XXK7_ANGAN
MTVTTINQTQTKAATQCMSVLLCEQNKRCNKLLQDIQQPRHTLPGSKDAGCCQMNRKTS